MSKYLGLFSRINITPELSLVVIKKITDSQAKATDYQLTHYQQTGKLLEIKPVKKYLVLATVDFGGGLNAQQLLGSSSTEQDAKHSGFHLKAAFPFISQTQIVKVNDIAIAHFML